MRNKNKKPELLAPVGNWSMLSAAVKNGADAVYLGVDSLNMRAKAKNFELDQLGEITEYCRENDVDVHLTLNSIVYEDEVEQARKIIRKAKETGVRFIICWDFSVIQLCREEKMPFCISTQASISNSSAANLYKQMGAERIVLARECTLEQIKTIRQNTEIEIEAFIHGAMCVAVSGRCFMSHHAFNQSANRGECIQNCRREYEIHDTSGETSFIIGKDYVMSPKDLCTIEFIDQLIDAGIDSFKIEGRKRSPDYIAKVVSSYRKAIDLHLENKLTPDIKKELKAELEKVYNRGFSNGFYFGVPGDEDYAGKYGSLATTKKVYVGKVLNYYRKAGAAFIKLEAGELNLDDSVYIIGNKTGCVELKISQILKDEIPVVIGEKGDEITFPCNEEIRPRDQVYKIVTSDL
ncbi:MAG: U32 family peptidase [Melioribacteraceae bacterium]|nr:U32 family peptidase [Melioribacteraceae bacterium]